MSLNQNAMKITGLSVPANTLAELAALDPTDPVNLHTLRICTNSTPPALVWCNGTIWVATDDGTAAA